MAGKGGGVVTVGLFYQNRSEAIREYEEKVVLIIVVLDSTDRQPQRVGIYRDEEAFCSILWCLCLKIFVRLVQGSGSLKR
jgi:hypothetical protein